MRKLLALLLLLPLLAHAGSVTGNIQTSSSGGVVGGTLTFTLNQVAVVSGTAQVVATGVNCYTSTAGAITGEPDPQTAPVLSVNLASGTLAAGTYFVKFTYFDGTGESLPSPEATITLASTGTVIVAAPALQPANATGWRVYISSASGTETRQVSQTGFSSSYQQTAALSAGAALPGLNTSVCSIRFQDEMIPTTTYYTVNLVNAAGSKIAGYPISQARFFGGTNGSVNVSSGWPVSIGGVVYPTPIVSTPNSNATQSIFSSLNLNGFSLLNANIASTSIGKLNNIIYVDGVKYPMTQVGIQSAFTDACAIAGAGAGTIVYIPPGTVSLTSTTGQQFTATCPLKVIGPGPTQLWFVVANTVPNTVPEFRVKPSGAFQGWFSFEGMRIVGNGKFGGDAFFLDSTNAGVNHFILNNVEIDSLDSAAWCVNMTAGAGNSFFFGQISNSHLGCGINMNASSTDDSWLIEHNNFGSSATDTLPCVNGTTQNGASHITLFNNNGGCNGGFFISHGTTECKIIYNQIEQPSFTSTEANSAVIDLIGDTYSIDNCSIIGNNMGSNNFVTRLIRLGTATNTTIMDNVLGIKATTGIGIDIVGATNTRLPFNEFIGVGGGAVAINNPGNATNFAVRSSDGSAASPAVSFLGNTDRGWFNVSGSGLVEAFAGLDIRVVNGGGDIVGSAMGRCFSSNVDPLAGAFDTCVSRSAAGVVSADTTAVGNSLGTFKATTLNITGNGVISGNTTTKRVLVVGAAPSCAVTGAGAGATCTVTTGSTDSGGQMNINSGTGPGASGTITLTFSSSFGANASACAMNLANGAAGWNARATIIGTGSSTSTAPFAWDNNAVTITASQSGTLAVTYWCSGR